MSDPGQQDLESAKERYILPNDHAEISRMYHQHEWVKGSAEGLIKAPIDLSAGRLRILDSATADGLWITDARSIFPDDAEFVGFDIAPELYPPVGYRAPNVQLVVQDLFRPFPLAWRNGFDLVHQRFIFPSFSDHDVEAVLGRLLGCVRPGGWIQLVEPDVITRVSDTRAETFEIMQRISAHVMKSPNVTPSVLRHLKEAGMVEIGSYTTDMVVGNKHSNLEVGIRGQKNFRAVMARYMEVCSPETFGLTKDRWQTLSDEFVNDTNKYKTAIRQNFIWARKPASAGI